MKTRDKYRYKFTNTKSKMCALGLMSGTSMDGVDISLLITDGYDYYKNIYFQYYPYPKNIKKSIKTFIKNKENFLKMQDLITIYHAKCIKLILKEYNYSLSSIDIVGFHGQTVFHAPDEGWTWQVGDGKKLSNILQIPVISNFRYRDICLGGEGAPLASLWHKVLFNSLDKKYYPCIFLNIGGVSNLTLINKSDEIGYCYDIGPGNGPIDLIMKSYFNLDLDNNGEKALSGKIHLKVIENILKHKWFKLLPPKSLDRNYFNCYILDCLKDINPVDKLATICKLLSIILKRQLQLINVEPELIYISGGGVHNKAIVKGMLEEFGEIIKLMENNEWNSDEIEAQAFAYLAVRSFKGVPLSSNSVTGISKDVSGGVLNFPN